MIQSTCVQCGSAFSQPKKPGRRRKRCNECKPAGYRERPVGLVATHCEQCGKVFESRDKPYLRKYCSGPCKSRAYRLRDPEKADERRAEQRATSCKVYVEPCDICGELRTWRSARRRHRACSPECKRAVNAKRTRDRYAANAEAERERIYAWRKSRSTPCIDCGGVVASVDKERCGQCQRKAAARGASEMHRKWRLRTSLASWQRNLAHALGPAPVLIEGRPDRVDPPPRHFTAGRCRTCRRPFIAEAQGARYCSPKCAPGWSPWITRHRRHRIYERDDWTCLLCGDDVPMVVTYLHPLGASLDHIVPRSRGGGDEDANLRMAHMLCNSLRGAPETGVAA